MHPELPLGGLGYVGVAAPDPARWREFALGVCGLAPAPIPPGASDGTQRFQMDDRQWRSAVHPGDAPELRYLGFEAPDVQAVPAAIERRSERGKRSSDPSVRCQRFAMRASPE